MTEDLTILLRKTVQYIQGRGFLVIFETRDEVILQRNKTLVTVLVRENITVTKDKDDEAVVVKEYFDLLKVQELLKRK